MAAFPETLRQSLDRADPNTLADAARTMSLGSMLRAMPVALRAQNPNTAASNGSQLATLQTISLPQDAKAHSIFRATARAGTAAAGELTVAAFGATPTTTQVAVAPNGDIVFLATDAYTNVDIVYLPERGDVFGSGQTLPGTSAAAVASQTMQAPFAQVTLPVSSNVLTLPSSITGFQVVLLMACVANTGTSTGTKIILVPGAGAPAAGQCRLNLAKTTVTFAAADAVTNATVDLLVGPVSLAKGGTADANAALTGASSIT